MGHGKLPVYHFDSEGIFLKRYNDSVEASIELKINNLTILSAIFTKKICLKKHFFSRHRDFVPIIEHKEVTQISRPNRSTKNREIDKKISVYKFDLNGTLIRKYNSLKTACISLDKNSSGILYSIKMSRIVDGIYYLSDDENFGENIKKNILKYTLI